MPVSPHQFGELELLLIPELSGRPAVVDQVLDVLIIYGMVPSLGLQGPAQCVMLLTSS